MDSDAASFDKHLTESLQELAAAFHHFHISYALIGGIAVGFRSRPRAPASRQARFCLHVFPGPACSQDARAHRPVMSSSLGFPYGFFGRLRPVVLSSSRWLLNSFTRSGNLSARFAVSDRSAARSYNSADRVLPLG